MHNKYKLFFEKNLYTKHNSLNNLGYILIFYKFGYRLKKA